jgi:hypothetical protein
MTSTAPFDLPGFLWDGRRFYKAPPEAKQAPTNPENASISNKRKKAKSSQQQVKKAIPIARSRRRSTLHEQLSDLALREWNGSSRSSLHQFSQLFIFSELWQSFRELISISFYHSDIDLHALTKFESTRILYPECLPNEEEIVKLSFDELNPAILRIGGSSGTIA